MSTEARVVLVKPGDILIFGNVGDFDPGDNFSAALTTVKECLGLAHIVVFEADIDLAAIPAEKVTE